MNHALSLRLLSESRVSGVVVALIASIAIPFFIHLLPSPSAVPIGAVLIPIFYAPFLALIYTRFWVALLTALSAPWLNLLVSGQPAAPFAIVLTIELLLFVLLSNVLKGRLPILAAPVAYVGAVVGTGLLAVLGILQLPAPSADQFILQTLRTALPGILALLVLNVATAKRLQSPRDGHTD